jgi:hypothetical protein
MNPAAIAKAGKNPEGPSAQEIQPPSGGGEPVTVAGQQAPRGDRVGDRREFSADPSAIAGASTSSVIRSSGAATTAVSAAYGARRGPRYVIRKGHRR